MSDQGVVRCHICAEPATCFGLYEVDHDSPEADPGAACDDCCGHGNEDGHCAPLDAIECEECRSVGLTVNVSD